VTENGVEVPIRVYLQIENRLLREALGRLFRKRAEFKVVGQGGQGEEKAGEGLCGECDVVAADFLGSGAEAAAKGMKVVLIGMDGEPAAFLRAVRAGICGYLLKDASATEVVSAMRAAMRGEAVCPPRLCAELFRCIAREPEPRRNRGASGAAMITLRQRQLAELVAQGLTNKEIAAWLNLSEFTVRNHIHRILKQVDAGSRREAVDAIFPERLRAGA